MSDAPTLEQMRKLVRWIVFVLPWVVALICAAALFCTGPLWAALLYSAWLFGMALITVDKVIR